MWGSWQCSSEEVTEAKWDYAWCTYASYPVRCQHGKWLHPALDIEEMKTFHGKFQHESIWSPGLSLSFSPVSHRPGLAAAEAVCQAPDATESCLLPTTEAESGLWTSRVFQLSAAARIRLQALSITNLVHNSAFLFHVTGLLPERRSQENMGILGGKPGSGGFLKVSPTSGGA